MSRRGNCWDNSQWNAYSQSLSIQGNGTLGLSENTYANIDWSYNDQRYRTERNSDLTVNNAYVRRLC